MKNLLTTILILISFASYGQGPKIPITVVGSGSGGSGASKFTTNGYGSIVDSTSTLYTIKADTVTTAKLRDAKLNSLTDSITAHNLRVGANTTNIALKSNIASPTFTGTVTIPTPFTLGATSVTSTGTQFNYLNAATGTTGTTSTNLVFSTSPTLVTPNLGTPSTLVGTNITGTAAGLTAGNVTTNANLTGPITSSGNATSVAAQTGTGSTFVMNTSPTLVTPVLGVATGTSLALGGSLDASSIADFTSTTKGFLKPRVTTAQMNAISNPVDGLEVFNTDEHVPFYYSTDWGWISNDIGWRVKNGAEYFDDFMSQTGANAYSNGFFTQTISSGALTFDGVPDVNRPGIMKLSTASSATGRAGLFTNGNNVVTLFNTGGRIVFEIDVRIPTLSTSGERFSFYFGELTSLASPTQSAGVWFTYDEGGVATGSAASANWQVATAVGSSRTYTTTGVAVTAGQWYKLKAIVNAAGTSVGFYIDGTLVRTETATLPTSSTNLVLGMSLTKSVGTTARTAEIDFFHYKQKFTTLR